MMYEWAKESDLRKIKKKLPMEKLMERFPNDAENLKRLQENVDRWMLEIDDVKKPCVVCDQDEGDEFDEVVEDEPEESDEDVKFGSSICGGCGR